MSKLRVLPKTFYISLFCIALSILSLHMSAQLGDLLQISSAAKFKFVEIGKVTMYTAYFFILVTFILDKK